MSIYRLDVLQVRFGYLFVFVVRMTHLISAEFPFTTDLTRSGHEKDLPARDFKKVVLKRLVRYHRKALHARRKYGYDAEMLDRGILLM